jgi:uncharacterized caspase-like protein
MANQACLAIGIDRYQSIQPLGYGVADAKSIADFFIYQAGWDRDRCLLLTDTSAAVEDMPTQPTRMNILGWLDRWCWAQLHAGQLLWLFFSGHGINYEGEDYLIPIDGDLENIPGTCISLRDIYRKLRDIDVNPIVCLDINRTQGASFNNRAGQTITKLAQEYQIPTFLSCQSHEFSHEAAALEHGLFTTALLEALNYNFDLNLETLESYLKQRSIDLSNHHWKPVQTPMAVIPTTAAPQRPIFTHTTQSSLQNRLPDRAAQKVPERNTPSRNDRDFADPQYSGIVVTPEPSRGGMLAPVSPPDTPRRGKTSKIMTAGLCLAGVAAAGAGTWLSLQSLDRNQNSPDSAIVPPSSQSESLTAPTQDRANPTSSAIVPSSNRTLAQAQQFVTGKDATSRYKAILHAQGIPIDSSEYERAQTAIDQWSEEILEIATKYSQKGDFPKAIGTAQMVPTTVKIYKSAQSQIVEWKNQVKN